jgi:hypothetical protein
MAAAYLAERGPVFRREVTGDLWSAMKANGPGRQQTHNGHGEGAPCDAPYPMPPIADVH